MEKVKKNDLIKLKESLILEISKGNENCIDYLRGIFIVKKIEENGEIVLENEGMVLKIINEKYLTKKGIFIQ